MSVTKPQLPRRRCSGASDKSNRKTNEALAAINDDGVKKTTDRAKHGMPFGTVRAHLAAQVKAMKARFGEIPEVVTRFADGPYSEERIKRIRSTTTEFRVWMADSEHAFKLGDKTLLIQAMHYCAVIRMPMPDWVARAFIWGVSEMYADYKMKSWDDLFGRPHKPKTRVADRKKKFERHEKLGRKVYERRIQLEQQRPRPPDIDGLLAHEFKIKIKTVREMCRQWKRMETFLGEISKMDRLSPA